MDLVLATSNPHKMEEVRALLPENIRLLSLRDIGCKTEIPETADTLHANALEKARYISSEFGRNCIADDSGLFIDALDGEPGVFSARYAGPEKDDRKNIEKVIRHLRGQPTSNARFICCIALSINGREEVFEGRVEGKIILEPRGNKGFGYDPIFVPEGYLRTFAELSAEEKNRISHRQKALDQLIAFLESQVRTGLREP